MRNYSSLGDHYIWKTTISHLIIYVGKEKLILKLDKSNIVMFEESKKEKNRGINGLWTWTHRRSRKVQIPVFCHKEEWMHKKKTAAPRRTEWWHNFERRMMLFDYLVVGKMMYSLEVGVRRVEG